MAEKNVCVVTGLCNDCKYTDCVTVCPVDCFYQDEKQLYIDPLECVPCEDCIAECPVEAIFSKSDVPSQWHQFIQINADQSAILKGDDGAHITQKQTPTRGPDCVNPNA